MFKLLFRITLSLLLVFNLWAEEPSYFFKNPDPLAKEDSADKSAELFKRIMLDVDLTPKTDVSIGQAPDDKTSIYFAVIKKGDHIDTVASYNKERKLQNYYIDREFNLYFATMKLEFNAPDNNISRLEMFDLHGIKKAYIKYVWKPEPENKEKVYLDSAEVFSYSGAKKNLVRVQSRYFTYGGGAFDKNIQKVNFGRANSSKYSNEFYGNSKSMVSYTRYKDTGKIQYTKLLKYSGDKIDQIDTYNEYGVLLSSDKKTTEAGEINEDYSPASDQ